MRDVLDESRVNYMDVRVIKDKNTGKKIMRVIFVVYDYFHLIFCCSDVFIASCKSGRGEPMLCDITCRCDSLLDYQSDIDLIFVDSCSNC